ncbi:twin-arginine translocase TatA/TatE family subunit [Chloroflexota bacterium]
MDLFGMGFGEIAFIILLALIVFGPRRIVDISRTLGKVSRTIRKTTSDLTTQITRETEEQDKKPPA